MKIGILTHYYGSNNYGGVLQAYALVKVLRDMGYDAEQVCFLLNQREILDGSCIKKAEEQTSVVNKPMIQKKRCIMIRIASRIKRAIYARTKGRYLQKKETQRLNEIEQSFLKPRREAFRRFRDFVSHSKNEYSTNALFALNDEYDAFITGSDQVWNLKWQSPAFFLEFADVDKKKIAYAASAGASEFDDLQKAYLKRVLPKYDAISVRESDLVGTYQDIAGVKAEFVLDPVLLLAADEWDNVASERLIEDKYLLCFFYDPTEKPYELAKKYAAQHGLKIATVSYALGDKKMKIEDSFGDYKLGQASPKDFISLIKYAECVFTDSFHCNAFSILYNRPFFTFGRAGMNGMQSRIVSLTTMFGCEDRFCGSDERITIDYLNKVNDVNYDFCSYDDMKKRSFVFLNNCLGKGN